MVDQRGPAERRQPPGAGRTAILAVLVMLAALALTWLFWFPSRADPFVLRIEADQGAARGPIAPPDRPLVLEIPPSHPPASAYEVVVVEAASGTPVLTLGGVRPGGAWLRVELPRGLTRAGRYDVRVTGQADGRTASADDRHFFIAAPP